MHRSSSRRGRGDGRFLRALRLVGLVATMALVAACNGSADASPSAAPTASPTTAPASAEPTAPATPAFTTGATVGAGPAPCAPADLRVGGGPWEAGAGSRFAEVTVVNQGAATCTLSERPTVAITDAGGSVLVATEPAGEAAGPSLAPGGSTAFSIQFANWCDPGTALPAHVLFLIAGGGIDIADLALPTTDDLPPCNGPEQAPTLSTTEWAPG